MVPRMAATGPPMPTRDRRGGEGWLRSVVENSSEIVTVVDPDGTLRYASPAFGRVFGYDPDQVVGTMNVLNLVHPDDLPHSGEVSQCERAYGKIDGGSWRRDGF